MDMIGPHVGGQQVPAAMETDLPHGFKHHSPAVPVEQIRRLIHALTLRREPLWIGIHQAASGLIVVTIHRTGFIAVQVITVAGKGNEVGHRIRVNRGGRTITATEPPCVSMRHDEV
jgi:hypothetical protein